MAAIAVMATVAAAQEQPTVTFSRPTMSMGEVLKAITQQTGVSVTANPGLRDVPILVSVKDVPLDELLDRIALVTGTKVEKRDYGLLFVADKDARKAQADREREWTEEAFDRAKQKLSANNKLPDRWTADAVDKIVADDQAMRERLTAQLSNLENVRGNRTMVFDSRMGGMSPARSSAFRVLDALPADVLASVGPGDRVVYTTRPTRMQKRMPFLTSRIVRDFVTNHNLLASRSSRAPSDPSIEIVGSVGGTAPIQGVSKMYVILSRGQQTQSVQVQVKFADTNGLFVGESSLGVAPDFGTAREERSSEGKVIELSQMSRDLAVIMAQETSSPSSNREVFQLATWGGSGTFQLISSGSSSLPKKIPDALMKALVDPRGNEPTGFYIAESFIQAGAATGKNVVAAFHDGLLPSLAQKLVQGKLTTGGLIAASTGLGLNVEQDDEWLTVSPIWASSARATMFDRKEASKLFGRIHSRGFATLDELADYSFSPVTGTPRKSLDLVYMSLINKDVADQFGMYVNSNLDMLRLYGSLPADMKRSEGEDIQVPTNRLMGKAKGFVVRVAYRPMGGFSFVGGMGVESRAIIAVSMEEDPQQRQGVPAKSVLREPTESMPNGLPAGSTLVFSRRIEDAVFASVTGVRGGKFMSAGQLGMQQGMLSRGGVMSQFMAGQNYDRFRLSQSAHITVAIDLGEIGRPSASFHDGWLLSGSRDLTYGQLPESFRQAVDAAKQRMANFGDFGIVGRRRVPPPSS